MLGKPIVVGSQDHGYSFAGVEVAQLVVAAVDFDVVAAAVAEAQGLVSSVADHPRSLWMLGMGEDSCLENWRFGSGNSWTENTMADHACSSVVVAAVARKARPLEALNYTCKRDSGFEEGANIP